MGCTHSHMRVKQFDLKYCHSDVPTFRPIYQTMAGIIIHLAYRLITLVHFHCSAVIIKSFWLWDNFRLALILCTETIQRTNKKTLQMKWKLLLVNCLLEEMLAFNSSLQWKCHLWADKKCFDPKELLHLFIWK